MQGLYTSSPAKKRCFLLIELTKLNGKRFVLNAELIETIETTPDAVITLTTDKKYVVKESKDEIILKVLHYKSKINLLTTGRPNNDCMPFKSEGKCT